MQKEDYNQLVTIKDLDVLWQKLLTYFKTAFGDKINPKQAFYSPKEFASITGMKYSTIVYRCKYGKLKARQESANCSWQISVDEIERFKSEAENNI